MGNYKFIFIKVAMVYKIRNKAFGAFFSSGASNRILFLPKQQLNPEISKHLTLQVQITRFNQMRTLHNYRNISRATKQFLNGDKMLENLMIMTIQGQYYRPNHYKAPIEQSYMIGRTLADLTDRHFGLFAANQHPI